MGERTQRYTLEKGVGLGPLPTAFPHPSGLTFFSYGVVPL